MSQIFTYRGKKYPTYIRDGNAMQYVMPIARQFCRGAGLDIGSGEWPLPGAYGIDLRDGEHAMHLPNEEHDYIFSSHCLEHLADPVAAVEHWKTRIKPGGVLFLYLPHPDMEYWRPENCRKHLHTFYPADVARMLETLGFVDVIHSERDLAWSFAVVGYNGHTAKSLEA